MVFKKSKTLALFTCGALILSGILGAVALPGSMRVVRAARTPSFSLSDDGIFTVSGDGVVTEEKVNAYLSSIEKSKYDIKEVTFSEDSNISEIGLGAFRLCECMETLTIPATVTSIGFRAFAYCKNLKNVYCFSPATNVMDTGDYVFRNVLRMRYIDPATNCDAMLGTPSETAPPTGDGRLQYSFLYAWHSPSENMNWLDPYRGNSGWFYGDTAITNIAMTDNAVIAQQLSKARGDYLNPSMDKQYDTSRTQFSWHGRNWYEDNWECRYVEAPLQNIAYNNKGKFTILGISDITSRHNKEASFVTTYFPKMTVDHTVGPEYDMGNVTKGAVGVEKPAETGNTQGNSSQSGNTQSGSTQTGNSQGSNTQGGTTQSGTNQTGTTQSGTTQSGNTQTGTTQTGNSQSGNTQTGTTQSGSTTGGNSQGDTASGGTTQAGGAAGGNSSSSKEEISKDVSDAQKSADDAQKAAQEAQKKAQEAQKAAEEAIKAAQEAEARAKQQSTTSNNLELEKAREAAKKAEEAQKKAEEDKKKADEELKKAQDELKAAEEKQKAASGEVKTQEETKAKASSGVSVSKPIFTAVRKGSAVKVSVKKCKGAKKYKLQVKTDYGYMTVKTTAKPGNYYITGKKGLRIRVVAINGSVKKKSKVIKVK